MKNYLLFILSLITMTSIAQRGSVIARLKTQAAQSPKILLNSGNIVISKNSASWQALKRPAVSFTAFELKDKAGRPVPPDRPVEIKSKDGKVLKTISAREYIDQLNQLEKSLNEQGYSLRTDKNIIVSKTVNPDNYLSGKIPLAPKPVAPLKTEAQIQSFMTAQPREVKVLYRPNANTNTNSAVTTKTTVQGNSDMRVAPQNKNSASMRKVLSNMPELKRELYNNIQNTSSTVYAIDEPKVERWDFGSPSTFEAGVECSLYRQVKVNAYADRFDTTNSVFKFSAGGKVWATVFNNEFDVLNALAEIYAPCDPSREMVANIYVKAMGVTLFSLPQNRFKQQMIWNNRLARSFDNSYSITIPIWGPLDFKGKIGIKGEVGFEYGAKLDRTTVAVYGMPYGNIDGYAEAGLDLAGIAGIGVGGSLNFISGYLPARASLGISEKLERVGQSTMNYKRHFILTTGYYVGYDIAMLNGSIYVYGELCVPDWVPFVGGDCARYAHEVFSWKGFDNTGTFAEDSQSMIIASGDYSIPVNRLTDKQVKLSDFRNQ